MRKDMLCTTFLRMGVVPRTWCGGILILGLRLAGLVLQPVVVVRGYDSQAFKASEDQLRRVWNLPDCSDVTQEAVTNGTTFPAHSIVWADEKPKLAATGGYPANLPVVMEILFEKLLGHDTVEKGLEATQEKLTDASHTCLFGVSALLFFYTKYLVDFEDDLDGAFIYHSLFDAFYAGSHPHLSEKGHWGFVDADVTMLRQRLLEKKFQRGKRNDEKKAQEEAKKGTEKKEIVEVKPADRLFLNSVATMAVGKDTDDDGRIWWHREHTKKLLYRAQDKMREFVISADNPLARRYYCEIKGGDAHLTTAMERHLLQVGELEESALSIKSDHIEAEKSELSPCATDLLMKHAKAKIPHQSAGAPPIKIYVYPVIETPTLFHHLAQAASFCGRGQWASEVHFHDWIMQHGSLRTLDPEEADYFFVPGYAICIFESGFLKLPEIDQAYRQLVHELPYFNQGRERRHIFTFGSGMGISVFFSWRQVFPEAIFLTPETSLYNDFPHITEAPFSSWKDIAIPGYLHRSEIASLTAAARPVEEKKYTVVFFGRTDPSRGVHPALGGLDVRNEIVRVMAEMPEPKEDLYVGYTSLHEMHDLMGSSRFCFIPRGKSAWSLRFYEALFADCVPVLLSDYWELPFADWLDYAKFTVKWPMNRVGPELIDYLRSVTPAVWQKMVAEIHRVRCWFVYPSIAAEIHYSNPVENNLPYLCRNPTQFAGDAIIEVLRRKNLAARDPILVPDSRTEPDPMSALLQESGESGTPQDETEDASATGEQRNKADSGVTGSGLSSSTTATLEGSATAEKSFSKEEEYASSKVSPSKPAPGPSGAPTTSAGKDSTTAHSREPQINSSHKVTAQELDLQTGKVDTGKKLVKKIIDEKIVRHGMMDEEEGDVIQNTEASGVLPDNVVSSITEPAAAVTSNSAEPSIVDSIVGLFR
ncbi:unnamed protein product [Amoebophrya sp. A25]|nr:unnamed protein product [Amoebophrya sp. A25]|eukprot:GSA25T00004310001.1